MSLLVGITSRKEHGLPRQPEAPFFSGRHGREAEKNRVHHTLGPPWIRAGGLAEHAERDPHLRTYMHTHMHTHKAQNKKEKPNKHGQRRTSSTCRPGSCTRGPLGGGEYFSRMRWPARGLYTTAFDNGFDKDCRFWLRCSRETEPDCEGRSSLARNPLGRKTLARMHPRVGGQTACVRLCHSGATIVSTNKRTCDGYGRVMTVGHAIRPR